MTLSLDEITPTKVVEIHISDMMAFRNCRLRWDVFSELRQGLEPTAPPSALWLGTGVHEALDQYYSQGRPPVEAFDEWSRLEVKRIIDEFPGVKLDTARMDKFDEDIELGKGMLIHYAEWAKTNDDFEVVSTEHSFVIEDWHRVLVDARGTFIDHRMLTPQQIADLPDTWQVIQLNLAGRGDALIRRNDGLWVFEHKTAAQVETERLLLEEQPGVYQFAMQQLVDEPIQGVYYNFLRKKLPTVPRAVQNGSRLTAQKLDTTYEVFLQAIRDNGFNPEDYDEELERLREKGNTFFYREEVYRSPRTLEHTMSYLKQVATDMVTNPVIYPSPEPMKDKMCPLTGYCVAWVDRADPKAILEGQLRPRRSRSVAASELQRLAMEELI